MVFQPVWMPISYNKDWLSKWHFWAINLPARPNVAHFVGSLDGTTVVTVCKLIEYFDSYSIKTALKGITKMHHFCFTSSCPGKILLKTDGAIIMNSVSIFCDNPGILQRGMPNPIIPKGLSLERRLYLHDNLSRTSSRPSMSKANGNTLNNLLYCMYLCLQNSIMCISCWPMYTP